MYGFSGKGKNMLGADSCIPMLNVRPCGKGKRNPGAAGCTNGMRQEKNERRGNGC